MFVNGVLCHSSGAILAATRPRFVFWCGWWDIAWNVLLCAYVNGFARWQPHTATLTVTAAMWIANGGWQGVKTHSCTSWACSGYCVRCFSCTNTKINPF